MKQNIVLKKQYQKLKQQYQTLQEKELYFWQMYEKNPNGILLQNMEGLIIYANMAASKLLGLTIEQLLGLTPPEPGWFALNEDGSQLSWGDLSEIVKSAVRIPFKSQEIMVNSPCQVRHWLLIHTTPIVNPNTGIVEETLTTFIDNTVRKHMEVYASLARDIDHQVLTEHSLQEVFHFLCKELVNTLGYPGGWIGIKEADGTVSFSANAGVVSDYLHRLEIRWDDTPQGLGAVGQCIRTGEIQVYNLDGNSQVEVWRPLINESKLHSVIALPLKNQKQVMGVLVLYSYLRDFSNNLLISQLEHFSLQMSIAFTAAKNREQLTRYRLLSENSRDIMLFIHPDGRILEANLAAIQTYGYTLEELLTLRIQDLRAPEITAKDEKQIEYSINQGVLYETVHCCKDGSTFPVEASSQKMFFDSVPVFLRIIRDISVRREVQLNLKKSEELYHEIIENTSNAVVVYEVKGFAEDFIFREFNNAAEKIENRSRKDVLGRSFFEVYPFLENQGIRDVFSRVWHTGQPEHYPLICYKYQRIKSWRDNYICKLPSGELVAIYADITSSKQAEEVVWLEKERAQVTLQSIGDAVITTDVYGNVDYLNPVAEELTGWSSSEAQGVSILQVCKIINEITGMVTDPVARCISQNRNVGLVAHNLLIHREGHSIAIEDSVAPIRDRQGEIVGAVLVVHDVNDKRILLHQIAHLANHDVLTGLPNRLLLNDRLSQALAQAHRKNLSVAVFFLDLDRFKLINDTLGHTMGDLLLKAVSERLVECLREGDTVARQGGDEFIIIIPELRRAEIDTFVVQKVLDCFVKPFILEKKEIFISPSIGVSVYPKDGQNIETLIKNADIAMYYAKEQGRNNYQFFTSLLNTTTFERLSLKNCLHKALEKGELFICYQPQIELNSGRIIGAEALLRWNSPENGLVSPAQFISIAEETGLIVPIGEWVLHTACAQNRAWQEAGYPPMRVGVNLSARQFQQLNLVTTINKILRKTKLSPMWLDLEITESIAMDNVEFTISMLRELKEMGIQISVDDFGTGFSSLNYLRRLPIDTLKIDRSFVEDITPDLNRTEVVTAIIQLAQNLGLKVIAEGVETELQLAFLREKGCNEMQGFLFSKPLTSKEFEALLDKQEQAKLDPLCSLL